MERFLADKLPLARRMLYRQLMRPYLSSLVLMLLGIACGGTTDSANQMNGGGSSSAGSHSAGASTGGSAGRASGGSSNSAGSGGSTIGSSGTGTGGVIAVGGTLALGGGVGVGGSGGGVVDARCPALRPTGMCAADEAALACEYETFSGCLCYMSAPGSFAPCQKIDPQCPNNSAGGVGGAGGAGGAGAGGAGAGGAGAGGAGAGGVAAAGAGGISAKIAVAPRQICSCTAANWVCSF